MVVKKGKLKLVDLAIYQKKRYTGIKGVFAILRIYLDNCCYNRPYDDQNQLRIELETKSKAIVF